jgi:hypothetical protein
MDRFDGRIVKVRKVWREDFSFEGDCGYAFKKTWISNIETKPSHEICVCSWSHCRKKVT